MVITWDVKITPLSIARKTASVAATRTVTDDTDPQNLILLEEVSYSIDTVILDTSQQKTDALNQIWQQHQVRLQKDSDIAGYIGGLEAVAKANLEARE